MHNACENYTFEIKSPRGQWVERYCWKRGPWEVTCYNRSSGCHMVYISLQWRHNGRDVVLYHQPHDCLLNRLFRRKKRSKLCVTGLCEGNSPVNLRTKGQLRGKCFYLMTSSCELGKYKRLRRRLECKKYKTYLAVDKGRLDHQRNIYAYLLTQAKQAYFKTKIKIAETSKCLY